MSRPAPQEPPPLDFERALGDLDPETRARRLAEVYAGLDAWQTAQVARHAARPRWRDWRDGVFTDFMPLAGDRAFAEDPAIAAGPARLAGRPVMVLAHDKGHDTATRVARNFGMAKPEGYRKVARVAALAGRMGLPIVALVDTPGAFPGIDAEERGQAEAIARATEALLAQPVPVVAAIVGEGGSGGAVAMAAADRVLMFDHAIYAVISPEGCASILWRDARRAPEAAAAMRITARDLEALEVIDVRVPEPTGAHNAPADALAALKSALVQTLDELGGQGGLLERRRARYLGFAGRVPGLPAAGG